MRKHRRNVLRHLRTAEFHKLSKLGLKIIAQFERNQADGKVIRFNSREERIEHFNNLFDDIRNEKTRTQIQTAFHGNAACLRSKTVGLRIFRYGRKMQAIQHT